MIFFLAAAEAGRCVNLHMRGVNLRLELAQKALAFRFQSSFVGAKFWLAFNRRRRASWNRRNTLRCPTHRAGIKISGVIRLALRAGQTVAGTPWRGQVCGIKFAVARKNSLGHLPGSGGCGLGRVHKCYSRIN